MRSLLLTVLAFVFSGRCLAEEEPRRWDQGDPTAEEQQAMEWVNAARRDPVGTVQRILGRPSDPVAAGYLKASAPVTLPMFADWLGHDLETAQQNGARFPNSSAISQAPLAFYPLFQSRATFLSPQAEAPPFTFPAQRPPPDYIYPVPRFGASLLNGADHIFDGPNATGGTAKFGPVGANFAQVSHANLYAAFIGPREWILSILTAAYPAPDGPLAAFLQQGDQVPDFLLGHTRLAGIRVRPGTGASRILTWFQASSEFLTTSDLPFGSATLFITGVAYRDANDNGVYDPGEGLGGVRVTPDHGGWYAVTSSSGGYAIPVGAGTGTYHLTTHGGALEGKLADVIVGADSVKLDWVTDGGAMPSQVPVAASEGNNRLIGLSTRGLVEDGAHALIGGFVIAGPANARKTILLRGVGPSLQSAGFSAEQCVAATRIELFDADARSLGVNQGWTSAPDRGAAAKSAATEVGDFPLSDWPGGGGDSALVVTLAPGVYSVLVSPADFLSADQRNDRVGLVEIYDVSRDDGARFVDISSRGHVGPGLGGLIVGCTVAGTGAKRLLVRGAGPALAPYGVAETLSNPRLTFYDAQSRPLAANADWSASEQTEQLRTLAAETGAFAWSEGSTDAALLCHAIPGNYSAVVSGEPGTGTSGVALVELYETP